MEVMGSDMIENHLQDISRHLTEFENNPKIIEGNLILDWFIAGENLFTEFYNLGNSGKWNASEIQHHSTVKDIVARVTKNQGWLQSFISLYPGLRVDLEGATSAADVCRVRSGIELLVRGFTGISPTFDKVLHDLEVLGELEEFDDRLKIWKEGHRPEFFPEDLHPDTPESHWWWF